MTKSVYLHVGLPKTGTTTIQQYLRDNEEFFRSRGFLYPGAKEVADLGEGRNHPFMMDAMMRRRRTHAAGAGAKGCRDVVDHTLRIFRDDPALHSLIFSQEGMAMSAPRWDRTYLTSLFADFDVAIVVFIRYIDVWIESLYREMVWARAAPVGHKPSKVFSRPLRKITDVSDAGDDDETRVSALEHGMSVSRALNTMRETLPGAKLKVRSFDTAAQEGRLTSCALRAFDMKLGWRFRRVDADAGVRNPTKSTAFTMFLYQMIMAQVDQAHIQSMGVALRRGARQGQSPSWLAERQLRFLPADAVMKARASYEALRAEFPQLPAQPDPVDVAGDHFLSLEESARLLDWLRPALAEDTYQAARHAIARRRDD